VIVLRAKQIEYQVTYINLSEKPDWFLKISPHGKVPVLLVDEEILFESNAIVEFLEDRGAPKLHPNDLVQRARHRAWTDFIADFSAELGKVYYAKDPVALYEALGAIGPTMAKLESTLLDERGNNGPYFCGKALSLVDAAYAPFFQRFLLCERVLKTRLLDEYPAVKAWTKALAENNVIVGSVSDDFQAKFIGNLVDRGMIAGAKLNIQESKSA